MGSAQEKIHAIICHGHGDGIAMSYINHTIWHDDVPESVNKRYQPAASIYTQCKRVPFWSDIGIEANPDTRFLLRPHS